MLILEEIFVENMVLVILVCVKVWWGMMEFGYVCLGDVIWITVMHSDVGWGDIWWVDVMWNRLMCDHVGFGFRSCYVHWGVV